MARVDAVMRFATGADGSEAVFDLHQQVPDAWLDGSPIDPSVVDHDERDVRPLRVDLADGEHELRLRYDLDLPRTIDPLPIGWTTNTPGVVFDLWMSDLHAG